MHGAPLPSQTSPPAADGAARERIYTAGTGDLRYTKGALALLFCWLLWGDFAFTFFEQIFGRFIPIYLSEDLHASNSLIGMMTGSIAGCVNILFLPNISVWSDNYRSAIGRRIPFLYVVTPLTAASLVGVGFAPEIGAWLHAHVVARLAPRVALTSAILVWICTLVVSFHFFNMVLVNAYNWLLRDVVPLELMARFLSWFRIVGSVASAGFLYWVFPHLQSHRQEVFLGVGLFYLVSFLLMCAKVKEGDYPPPPPVEHRPGFAKTFAIYFRECLSVPLYRYFFLAYIATTIIGMCSAPFALLFTKTTLGINMSDLGHFFAWSVILSSVAYVPLGWLCDRFSPIVVAGLSLLGQLAGALCVYFLVHDKATYLAASLASSIPAVGWGLSSAAMTMKLFPEEKFGQFSSALNVFGCGALILGNVVVGNLMDLVHSNYRMIYLWNAFLLLAAIPPLCLVYREWRRHGGHGAYVAPLPTEIR